MGESGPGRALVVRVAQRLFPESDAVFREKEEGIEASA